MPASVPGPAPNKAVEPTPNSFRSCVAPAIGRGSPRALGVSATIMRELACVAPREQKRGGRRCPRHPTKPSCVAILRKPSIKGTWLFLTTLLQPTALFIDLSGQNLSGGFAAFKQFFDRIPQVYSELTTTIHDLLAEEDRVACRLSHRAVHRGEWSSRLGRHAVGGKTVRWSAMAMFRFREGKIAEEWVNRDELGMLLDLGVVAPAATSS